MQNIYVLRDNQQTGPFTEAEVRSQLAGGAINAQTMIWWEGLPEWTALARTPLSGGVAPLTSPTGLPAAGAPIAPGVTGTTKTSTLAIVSLTCGVIGILCTPVLGLTAVITGHMARGQIRKDPTLSGDGLALAGVILGYLWLLLCVISIVALFVLQGLGNQVKDTFKTIQSQMEQAEGTNNTLSPTAPTPGQ